MKNLFFFNLLLIITLSSCGVKKERKDHTKELIKQNKEFFSRFGDLKAYKDKSLEKKLIKCIHVTEKEKSCTFKELPLIGQVTNTVSINDVLNRTLISHKEFGDNFKNALEKIDNKILMSLFGSVTAVVISDKINPSFYSSYTGTIYLSGRQLWTSEEMRNMSFKAIDKRGESVASANWSALSYEVFVIRKYQGINIRSSLYKKTRTIDELIPELFSLLIHELTHANDYFPRAYYTSMKEEELNKKYAPLAVYRYKFYKLVSDKFKESPKSDELKAYAQVLYHNKKLQDTNLMSLDAIDIAKSFISDNTTDLYGYSTPLEDLAMLIQDYISLGELGIEKKMAVANYPNHDFTVPKGYEYKISWGSKNRILNPVVLKRAEHSIKMIFPNFDTKEYFAQKLSKYNHSEQLQEMLWVDFLKQ